MISALYVDDEPALLEIAKAFLEIDGEIKVETATSAMDALVKLETAHFDAVICDYQMPMVDGLQFLKTLRLQGRTVPFILFTGKGREDVVIEALNNGADFYLQKGGDPKSQFIELQNILKRSVDQRRAEETAKESEEIYEKLFKENIEAMLLVDPRSGKIEDANHAAARFSGHERARLMSMHVQDLGILQNGQTSISNGNGTAVMGNDKLVMKFRCASGEIRDVEVFSGTLRVHGRSLGYAIIHDITDMILAERREERLNRVFKALSVTGQLIIRAQSELELVEGTCRILVDHGKYDLVWIGVFENEGRIAKPVAFSSGGKPTMENLAAYLEWSSKAGPALEVYRNHRAVIVRNMMTGPWSEMPVASEQGSKLISSVSLPLMVEGEAKGVLSIHASVEDAFDSNQAELLQELANNLSEALTLINHRQKEGRMLDVQAAFGRQLSDMIDVSSTGFFLLDRKGSIRTCNAQALAMLNKTKGDVIGKELQEVLPMSPSGLKETMAKVLSSNGPVDLAYMAEEPEPRYFKVQLLPSSEGLGMFLEDVTSSALHDEELKRERDLFHLITETSPVAVVVFDDLGDITYANRHAEDILGPFKYALARIRVDSSECSITSVEGRPLTDQELPFAIARSSGEPVWNHRLALEQTGHKRRMLSINASPMKDLHGKVYAVVAIVEDISAISEAIGALQQSESRLREITEGMLDIVVKFDPQGTILFVSPSVKEVLGLEVGSVVGHQVYDFIHPDDIENVKRSLETAGKREPTQLAVKFRLGAHGSYKWVEAVGRPLYGSSGQLIATVGNIRDVTERQLAENRLWDTGGKLRAIIQTSPLAILSLDPDGSISTWNPAAERIFGWTALESIQPFSFLPPDDEEETRELKERIIRGERMTDVEVIHKEADGRERTISLSTAPILDHAGRVGGIIVVASDTSERKRMEDRLIQLNEVLRLVNRILRHDTLNELMVVNGSLEMYHQTNQERFLVIASKAISRSVEMIKRMKEMESLAISGGPMREYDLHQVVENVLKGYVVEYSVVGDASLFADDALGSAIDNIVRNAMVHGKADRIEVRIWQEGAYIFLSIADNGNGIPDSIKKRIFEEGFSFGNNAGSGLGLYLVSKAVERYGGKVKVEDNIPRGSSFVLTFPRPSGDPSSS